jgi:hypothetical protein
MVTNDGGGKFVTGRPPSRLPVTPTASVEIGTGPGFSAAPADIGSRHAACYIDPSDPVPG